MRTVYTSCYCIDMNTNEEARPTAADLTTDIYVHTADLQRRTDQYGNVELELGDHRMVIADEREDEDTPNYEPVIDLVNWLNSHLIGGVNKLASKVGLGDKRIDEEEAGNAQNWEPTGTSGTQDAAELLADVRAWIAQAQA